MRPVTQRQRPQPTTPSPMMGQFGEPAGSPPLPWPKYILALLGFPVRTPKIWDQWEDPQG